MGSSMIRNFPTSMSEANSDLLQIYRPSVETAMETEFIF